MFELYTRFAIQVQTLLKGDAVILMLLIVIALVLLFIEILTATRSGAWSVVDHLLSAIVFVAFLVEFLLVREAATDVFFILTVIAFIDLIAGFSVSIKSAGRDVSIGL